MSVTVEGAQRIVALNRKIDAYQAMADKGKISQEECDALCSQCTVEVARIRSQAALSLKTETSVGGKGAAK